MSVYLVALETCGFGRHGCSCIDIDSGYITRILHDFEGQVVRTESKLAAATRRMNFFLQKAEGVNLFL